jgi:NADH:ubiquinone oxidoreductase subunit 5 (subunit L)/multisubunit Na+/H+ antiporter MnhA subunit
MSLFKLLLLMCAGGVIHSIGDFQDIRFIGGLSVYITFTSSSLIVSNFALSSMPFLPGFYPRDFILEMFSMRYINMFEFFFYYFIYGFNSLLVFPFVLFCYMW